MRFGKKFSCQLRTAALPAFAVGFLAPGALPGIEFGPGAGWQSAAGLAYGGWPGVGGQSAGWLRGAASFGDASESVGQPGEHGTGNEGPGERAAITGELRQTTPDGRPVFFPSLAWQRSPFELFAGSRDVPGQNPLFLSDPPLLGHASAMADGLPRGRSRPLAFFRPLMVDGPASWFPGVWGARGLAGPGAYLSVPGVFLALHPTTRIWGVQLISGRESRPGYFPLSYRADFEGQKREIAGYASVRLWERLPDAKDPPRSTDPARVSLDVTRFSEWDGFRYRAPASPTPERRYRSWAASLSSRVGPVRMQLAGQDRGDTTFRVVAVERAHPEDDGWYFSPVLRRHMLRLYEEDLTKEETIAGAGVERIARWGVFRAVLFGGWAASRPLSQSRSRARSRSLGAEILTSIRLGSGPGAWLDSGLDSGIDSGSGSGSRFSAASGRGSGFLDFGLVVAGSEDADSFLFLPVQDVGQGQSHFYDRSTQALMLRAVFPGVEVSFHYGVRRSSLDGLRDWGSLRAAVSRSF